MILYAIIGTLIGISVLWIIFRLTKTAQIEPKYSCGYYYPPGDKEIQAITFLNQERYMSGAIGGLEYCPQLDITARMCANYLNKGGEWSHRHFREVSVPNMKKEYPDIQMGEILGRGYSSLEDTVKAWMESDSHRRTIMFPRYECMGYAHVGEFYVIHFAYEKR